MFKKTLIATMVLCGAAPAAWSQATLIPYDGSIEASTDYVSVPSTAYGAWSVTPCAGCRTAVLRLDENSEFFVGKEPVPFATLRKYAARGANHLDIFYDTKTQLVTRVTLRMQLDTADVPSKQPGKAKQGGAVEPRTKS